LLVVVAGEKKKLGGEPRESIDYYYGTEWSGSIIIIILFLEKVKNYQRPNV